MFDTVKIWITNVNWIDNWRIFQLMYHIYHMSFLKIIHDIMKEIEYLSDFS